MTEPCRIHVGFKKSLSDGNYGNESAEVVLEYECQPGEEQTEFVEVLLQHARRRVHAELARSPSSAVRRALEPPPARAAIRSGPPDEPEDPEDLPY